MDSLQKPPTASTRIVYGHGKKKAMRIVIIRAVTSTEIKPRLVKKFVFSKLCAI